MQFHASACYDALAAQNVLSVKNDFNYFLLTRPNFRTIVGVCTSMPHRPWFKNVGNCVLVDLRYLAV